MPEKRSQNEIERRFFPVTELRAVTDDKGIRHIVGYAAVFNALSEDMGGWRERIVPGAFTRAIKEDDVRGLWNHNSDIVLGRSKKGTLSLSEDLQGLHTDIMPPDTQLVKDMVMVPIDRGDVSEMSFGFMVRSYPDGSKGARWIEEGGMDIRELLDVELFDVSPVTFAAYPDTKVALRSLEEYRKQKNTSPAGGKDMVGGGCDSIALLGEEDESYRKIMCL